MTIEELIAALEQKRAAYSLTGTHVVFGFTTDSGGVMKHIEDIIVADVPDIGTGIVLLGGCHLPDGGVLAAARHEVEEGEDD